MTLATDLTPSKKKINWKIWLGTIQNKCKRKRLEKSPWCQWAADIKILNKYVNWVSDGDGGLEEMASRLKAAHPQIQEAKQIL